MAAQKLRQAGEILVQTTRTLISTETEGIVLTGNFALGTHWHNWVKFPFQEVGYLHAGRVVEVGAGVETPQIGDRVATHSPHAGLVVVRADRVLQQFLENRRMQHACHLLHLTELRVAQVAREVGYDDPFYFSNRFRRNVGQSLSLFRRYGTPGGSIQPTSEKT